MGEQVLSHRGGMLPPRLWIPTYITVFDKATRSTPLISTQLFILVELVDNLPSQILEMTGKVSQDVPTGDWFEAERARVKCPLCEHDQVATKASEALVTRDLKQLLNLVLPEGSGEEGEEVVLDCSIGVKVVIKWHEWAIDDSCIRRENHSKQQIFKLIVSALLNAGAIFVLACKLLFARLSLLHCKTFAASKRHLRLNCFSSLDSLDLLVWVRRVNLLPTRKSFLFLRRRH